MIDIKTENIWLMKGDCLERMKEIPIGSVKIVLTDPPYELSKSKGGGMMSGGRKFMQQVRDAGMIDGINTASFLDACLDMFDIKQRFCGVFTCSNKQVIGYISWAEYNGFTSKEVNPRYLEATQAKVWSTHQKSIRQTKQSLVIRHANQWSLWRNSLSTIPMPVALLLIHSWAVGQQA